MQNRHGFTLIELSIVLVIIGLVIGGVIAGKEMIEQAKIRSEISQLDKFRVAEDLFKSKYGYIPGDMPSATASQFNLPRQVGGWSIPAHINGNGVLNGQSCTNCHTSNIFGSLIYETYQYFFQLDDVTQVCGSTRMVGAGLLISGLDAAKVMSSCGYSTAFGTGPYFPRSKINPQYGILPVTANNFSLSTWYILNGKDRTGFAWIGNHTDEPSLRPWQALQLDSKTDDGVPSTGKVRAYDVEWLPGYVDQYVINDDVPGECIVDAAGTSYNLRRNEVLCHVIVKK